MCLYQLSGSDFATTSLAHIDHIYRLAWRPKFGAEDGSYQLASCGEDGTLKLLTVHIAVE